MREIIKQIKILVPMKVRVVLLAIVNVSNNDVSQQQGKSQNYDGQVEIKERAGPEARKSVTGTEFGLRWSS